MPYTPQTNLYFLMSPRTEARITGPAVLQYRSFREKYTYCNYESEGFIIKRKKETNDKN